MKSWIQYRIVQCGFCWKPDHTLHFYKGFGPYIPRWRWVQKLLEMTSPTLCRTKY